MNTSNMLIHFLNLVYKFYVKFNLLVKIVFDLKKGAFLVDFLR